MRHRKKTIKLSRTSSHRDAMLRNLVASLILHEKVKTSKARAKAARSLAATHHVPSVRRVPGSP